MRPLWTVALDGGPRRVNHSAVVIGETIFSFGGYSSTEERIFQHFEYVPIDVFAFSTALLRWKKVHYGNARNRPMLMSSVPYMRYGHATVAINHKAYLFGGRDDFHGACNTVFSFDVDQLLWLKHETHGHIPGPRDGHGMCQANGNVYVFGGYVSDDDMYTDELFMLDLSTWTWMLLRASGQSGLWRDFHTFTPSGDKIYMFGGRSEEIGQSGFQRHRYDNEIKVLDLKSLKWSNAAKPNQKLPIGRRSHAAFFHNDCLYIFGGYNSVINEHFDDIWRFDSRTGLWTEVTTSGEKPCQRRRHCCCYSNKRAYVFGGTSPIATSSDGDSLVDLRDLSDIHILDLEPSLKTLCFDAILKYRHQLDLSVLPESLRATLRTMTTDSDITITRNVCQG